MPDIFSLGVELSRSPLPGIPGRPERYRSQRAIAQKLVGLSRRGGSDPAALLELTEVFGMDLPANTIFRKELEKSLKLIYEKGSSFAVSQAIR